MTKVILLISAPDRLLIEWVFHPYTSAQWVNLTPQLKINAESIYHLIWSVTGLNGKMNLVKTFNLAPLSVWKTINKGSSVSISWLLYHQLMHDATGPTGILCLVNWWRDDIWRCIMQDCSWLVLISREEFKFHYSMTFHLELTDAILVWFKL